MSRALPILFNTDMVRAILDGRKKATRRIVKSPYFVDDSGAVPLAMRTAPKGGKLERQIGAMPYPDEPYKIDDILYVRETWGISNLDYDDRIAYIVYRASDKMENEGCQAVRLPDEKFEKLYDSMSESSADWRPSIHMPKEAARIWLKVTDVRVERLNEMTLEDFLKEGVMIRPEAFNDPENAYQQAKDIFIDIWDSTIKKSDRNRYGWDANPWTWVTEFEWCEKPEGEMGSKG